VTLGIAHEQIVIFTDNFLRQVTRLLSGRLYRLPGQILIERLAAAARTAGAGYRIAFKCEPVIADPGWRDGYCQMFDSIAEGCGSSEVTPVRVLATALI